MSIEESIKSAMAQYNLHVEAEIARCIADAIRCGDFMLHTRQGSASVAVDYVPYRGITELKHQLSKAQDDIKYLLEVISHHESQQFNTQQMYYDRVHRIRGTRDKGEG